MAPFIFQASFEYSERQSVKDPKIFKQLLKNNEKHEIPRIVEDLKEDKKHGSNYPLFFPLVLTVLSWSALNFKKSY